MAVIQLPENKYIKIITEDSYVNDYVFVHILIYHEESDRLNEKSRSDDFQYFKTNCLAAINVLHEELEAEAVENSYDINNLPESFLNKIEYVSALEDNYYKILSNSYKYVNRENAEITLDAEIEEFFNNYKYSSDWIDTPINIDGGLYYNCGVYNGEEITPEFYYNKLKEMMKINGYLDN